MFFVLQKVFTCTPFNINIVFILFLLYVTETIPGELVVKTVGTDSITVTWGLLPVEATSYTLRISTDPPADVTVTNDLPFHTFNDLNSGQPYTIEILYFTNPSSDSIQTSVIQRTCKNSSFSFSSIKLTGFVAQPSFLYFLTRCHHYGFWF